MLEMCVFNVGLGQCIFLRPAENNGEYSTLIDCGSSPGFSPADFIKQFLPRNEWGQPNLKSLVLTNYDEDHFSGVVDLKNKVKIETISFAKNLSSDEIKNSKDIKTTALTEMLALKDGYTGAVSIWNPPYTKQSFSLNKNEIQETREDVLLNRWDTNNLSQLVFIEYKGFVICIPGDLEQKGWRNMLEKRPDVKPLLQRTRLLMASHHGRDNGYYPDIFNYCSPECVIISDEPLQYGTQDRMAAQYATHLRGNGILFEGTNRKVLTTRCDGHMLITIDDIGMATYKKLGI